MGCGSDPIILGHPRFLSHIGETYAMQMGDHGGPDLLASKVKITYGVRAGHWVHGTLWTMVLERLFS